MEHASERVLELARVREGPDAGGEHVHEVIELIPLPYLVPLHDVLQIRLLKEPLEIPRPLLVRAHRKRERHASVHRVLGPALVAIAIEALHELGEGQRSHAHLVPAPPELGHHVVREELRVAPRHVHVDVAHAQKPVEHAVEPERNVRALELLPRDGVLDLVEKDVVLLVPVCDLRTQVSGQRIGIAESGVLLDVERDLDDVLVIDALLTQVVAEEVEEQIRLPAATDACDHLNHTVVHAVDEAVEISVPPDFHAHLALIPDRLLLSNFAACGIFSQ